MTKWWRACPQHGNDLYPDGSCHDCAMLMPDWNAVAPPVSEEALTCLDILEQQIAVMKAVIADLKRRPRPS